MVPRKGATKGGPVGTGFGECKGFVTHSCGIRSVCKFFDSALDYARFINEIAAVLSWEKAGPSLFRGEKV